jgi:tetratricopeptide (TPR) repeat protein
METAMAFGRAICVLALTLLPIAAAAGEYETDLRHCLDQSIAPERRADACTGLLASGRLPAEAFGETLSFRGVALAAMGRYDEAVRDYEAAARLDPRLAEGCGSIADLLAAARLALERAKGS